MKKIIILFAVFFGLVSLSISSATAAIGDPAVSSMTNMVSGESVTVGGVNFGTKHLPADYDYFDGYSSDWSCDKADNTCTIIPSGEDMQWIKQVVNDDYLYMANIVKNPLMNINKANTNYSTGRAWNIWPEYYTGPYGYPNSSLVNDFPNTNEIFAVYYKKIDPNWPIYAPIQDKDFIIYGSVSHAKLTGAWASRSGNVQYEMTSEMGGNYLTDCPTCAGWDSLAARGSNNYLWPGKGKWIEHKIYLKMNAAGNHDGAVKVWVNNHLVLDDSSVQWSTAVNDLFDNYRISGNWSSSGNWASLFGFLPGQEFYDAKDDVLINYSSVDPTGGIFPATAIVYLSNNPTWGTGPVDVLNGDAAFARQVVGGVSDVEQGFKAWSDNQFKFVANTTGLNTIQPIYLYVTNWSGKTNEQGFLTGNSTPPPAPTTYNLTSFTRLVTDWLKTISSPADVNSDGKVNSQDLGIMMSNWN